MLSERKSAKQAKRHLADLNEFRRLAKRKGSPRGETNSADMVSPLDVSLETKPSKILMFFENKTPTTDYKKNI